MSTIKKTYLNGIHVDAYWDNDGVVDVLTHLVLWEGSSPQPVLCVRELPGHGLTRFAVTANDDIPAHLKRSSLLNVRAEVQYDDAAQGAVSAVAIYQGGGAPVLSLGNLSAQYIAREVTQVAEFGVCAITIDLPAWVNEGLEYEEEEALKDALLGIPGAVGVTLYAGGTLEIDEPGRLRDVQRMAESVCRAHAKNPPAVVREALPFMMFVDGMSKVCDGLTGVELDSNWSGICTSAEDVKSLWHLGWDGDERSFTKLRSTTREAALQELRERSVASTTPESAGLSAVHFEFLHWFKQCALFPGDLESELIELGAERGMAFLIARCDAVKKSDVVGLMADYGDEVAADGKPLLASLVSSYWNKFQQLRQNAQPGETISAEPPAREREWRYGANKGSVYMYPEEGGVSAGYQWVATTNPEMVGLPEDQEAMERHADRLAACANACRGMDDPVAEVSALQQVHDLATNALQRGNADEHEPGGPGGR